MVDYIDGDDYENFEVEELINGKRVVVPSDIPLKIYREEMEGKVVYLYTGTGFFLGTIEINKPGNKHHESEFLHVVDQTYTYTLPSGYEVLLTVPQVNDPPLLFTVGKNELAGFYIGTDGGEPDFAEKQCRLMVENDGSLNIRDMDSPQKTEAELVTILEPDDDSGVITKVERSQLVSKEWSPISLREDQAMYLHTGDFCAPKAIIYKIPNLWYGYMMREMSSGELYPLDGLGHDNDFYTFSYNGGLTLQVRQYDGILEIRADGMLFSDKMAGKSIEYVSAGEDGHFSGKINGGRPIAGFTVKSVGGPELSKYARLNEDNYGVNYVNGRVVVADGIGGQMHGQHASALATRWIANSNFPLNEAIYNAQRALQVLGAANKKNPPDTVFAVAEFQGDFVKIAHTGDCAIIHVTTVEKEGKSKYVLSETRSHTVLQSMIDDKDVTEREGYTNPNYALQGVYVTSTLISARVRHQLLGGAEVDQVDYGNLSLKKGDYVLLISDGAKVLTDEDIIGALEAGNPNDIVFNIKEIIRAKNEMGHYLRDFHDGKPPAYVRSAIDNTTVIVVKHE